LTNRVVGRWNFQDPTQSFHQILRVQYGLNSMIEPLTGICGWGGASGESKHQKQGNAVVRPAKLFNKSPQTGMHADYHRVELTPVVICFFL
jgi:hypothetical protein